MKYTKDYIRLLREERDELQKKCNEQAGELRHYQRTPMDRAVMHSCAALSVSMFMPEAVITKDGIRYWEESHCLREINKLRLQFESWVKT